MRIRCLPALTSLLLTFAVAAPAAAGVSPYVRVDFGANEFRMTDVDHNITATQHSLQDAGIYNEYTRIGSGYGPMVSVGLWLTRNFRVGATYASHRAVTDNWAYRDTTFYFLEDRTVLRMNEVGAEAALRFPSLGGFTVGANVAQGHAQLYENSVEMDQFSEFLLDGHAKGDKLVYGGYVGIDQTSSQGLAGYVRVGFMYRDVGRLDGEVTTSDGFTSTTGKTKTSWLDYSGFYATVGVGFDLLH